jgi:hypothetical protein
MKGPHRRNPIHFQLFLAFLCTLGCSTLTAGNDYLLENARSETMDGSPSPGASAATEHAEILPSKTTGCTPTNTVTKTPTPSPPTPTPSPTPTVKYNGPGSYSIHKCATYHPVGGSSFVEYERLCIPTINVQGDLSLQVVVIWTVKISEMYYYIKQPDSDNHYIYLQDDNRNVYNHTKAGGCAAAPHEFWGTAPQDCTGWFLFPTPRASAESFILFDSKNGFSIPDIVLLS